MKLMWSQKYDDMLVVFWRGVPIYKKYDNKQNSVLWQLHFTEIMHKHGKERNA